MTPTHAYEPATYRYEDLQRGMEEGRRLRSHAFHYMIDRIRKGRKAT